MFIAIIWGKVHRYIPALIGALTVILVLFLSVMHDPQAVLSVLNIEAITHYEFWIPGQHHIESASGINWQTIIFIAGMMIMVEGMGEAGFFRMVMPGSGQNSTLQDRPHSDCFYAFIDSFSHVHRQYHCNAIYGFCDY